jgi:formate dehydrogenase subunit gamma
MSERRGWDAEVARDVIASHGATEGPLLPILHDLQSLFGHVPHEAVPILADALNLSRAEVHGVITFYHDFRAEPAGRHVLKLCQAEACQSMGARDLAEHLRQRLDIGLHETTADGRITVEPVYCLGNCACAPAAMADGELVGRIDAKRLDRIVDKMEGLGEAAR